jgi:probable O-glycosylation ligase (exosortase A-associated)
MRDLILLIALPIFIYFAFRRPIIGLSLWLWTSLVPMQEWSWGIATSIRWNLLFAACTLLGVIFKNKEYDFKVSGLLFLVLFFFLQSTVSTIFTIGDTTYVWQRWDNYFKAIIFFIMCCAMLRKKIHFEAIMCACLMSVIVAGGQEALKFLASGGGHTVHGISSTFNDNNLAALATLMCIPMCLYLFTQYKQFTLLKYLLLCATFSGVMFVLGSDSRGGFLGLLVLAGYYIINSEKKIPLIIISTIVGAIALSFMGDEWFNRMETIKSAEQDSSFLGRVISWKLSLLLAMDRPFLGGGFDAIIHPPTWLLLSLDFDKVNFITTPEPSFPHVAHSSYFQVLGNQGFLGLFLFILILLKALSSFNKVKRLSDNDSWMYHAAFYSKISLIVFMVSGAALNFAYREILLIHIAFAVSLEIIVKKQLLPVKKKFR